MKLKLLFAALDSEQHLRPAQHFTGGTFPNIRAVGVASTFVPRKEIGGL